MQGLYLQVHVWIITAIIGYRLAHLHAEKHCIPLNLAAYIHILCLFSVITASYLSLNATMHSCVIVWRPCPPRGELIVLKLIYSMYN